MLCYTKQPLTSGIENKKEKIKSNQMINKLKLTNGITCYLSLNEQNGSTSFPTLRPCSQQDGIQDLSSP
jgi:hypothetical protein